MATYKEWMEITYEQGTRGDMVMDVLRDWKQEREELISALRDCLVYDCKRAGSVGQVKVLAALSRAGLDPLNL